MFFMSLPPVARTALLLLAAVVLAITILTPDAGSSSRQHPMGVVVTNTGTEVTVRTGDGETYTADTDPYSVRHCTAGRTFPTCSH